MNTKFVVVDGSNIATEGRSSPSLAQLDEAVREFQQQFPDTQVIVVVDATFGHRIDASERRTFDEAIAHGEIVSPPAGAIGRGDAFLLRIAERVTAQVLSNDSFQEFHSDHPWLFEEGRLIGGTPVPGVGWIFSPRTPVRGARSRSTTPALSAPAARGASDENSKKSGRAKKADVRTATTKRPPAEKAAKAKKMTSKNPPKKTAKPTKPAKAAKAEPATTNKKALPAPRTATKKAAKAAQPAKVATGQAKAAKKLSKVTKKSTSRSAKAVRRRSSSEVAAAIERATEEVLIPGDQMAPAPSRGRGRARQRAAPAAVNDPITFLEFVSEHPIGSRVEGEVASFMSHGAMVDVGEMRCYVPLKGLGLPAPSSARDVLKRGEARTFVLVGLDVPRRGAELALPEVVTGEGWSG